MSQEKVCEFFRLMEWPEYEWKCMAFDWVGVRPVIDVITYQRFCECDSERCGYHFYATHRGGP